MTDRQILILILILTLSVQITRALPFLIFREKEKLPEPVEALGKLLPPAMMGLLVVYCFKDSITAGGQTLLLQIIASLAVVLLHLWKRNTILSIAGGTVIYMLLIRLF